MAAIVKTGRYPAIVRVPFTGKGAICKTGRMVIPGVTQGTDLGLAIASTANADWTDAIGLLRGDSVVASDSVQAGTTWTFAEVELIDSYNLVEIDYSTATADLVTVISFTGTTITITSLENNADCGWFYVAAGTGVGQLMFATACTGGTATIKTAPTVALDATSKLVHIKRFGHKLHFTNTAGQLASQAAVGSVKFFTLETYIDSPANGIPKQILDPTKHDNITLKQLKVTFSAVGLVRNNAGRN
jgi:hypothetical protein